VRRAYGACPQIDGARSDPADAEQLTADQPADDVDERIQNADFMEVDMVFRHVMRFSFRVRQSVEYGQALLSYVR